MKETLEQSGYELIARIGKHVVLRDPLKKTQTYEMWFMNDGHASYGIIIDGHQYEFVKSGETLEELSLS